MINHKEIHMIICRLYHYEKEEWFNIIEGAKARGLIEVAGKNAYGVFYKVNNTISLT